MHIYIVHDCTCTVHMYKRTKEVRFALLCKSIIKKADKFWLLPHVRITKLHKHSVLCIGRARAQFG